MQSAIAHRKIILASQSPRRRQLLEWAEIKFEVVIVPTEEQYPAGLPVEEIPIHIAREKANAVQHWLSTRPDPRRDKADAQLLASAIGADALPSVIIAADTVVVAAGRIIGKPASPEEAFQTLSLLSGNVHQVITGVCLRGREEVLFSDITSVEFHHLTKDEIMFYIEKYRPYDKAGAYGIQEWIGVTGIKRIEGDFYNVMGLPVSRVLQALKSGRL